ncbi:ABC transporter substrate binding protein [Bradyrhizobium sp.]|uniref:ABC transporter substrate binding protein n=1 Tax=Bradyrhizobium sp. TaxID=376 RepID=UPI002D74D2EE|nr:ABC transporter substrate binding protein [Bradyrhizobium sp.]HZR76160.1 ABC transporter substrate binding protein [Bradyrhizobium sp.]
MRRRQFIALLGGAATSWPFFAHAQQGAMPLIGYLGSSSASIDRPRLAAFLKRLGELGWVKDRKVRSRADALYVYRRAAEIVDKVLRGAKPADIPVEAPTAFKFVLNLKTAKELGLSVPYSVQLLADEVIE